MLETLGAIRMLNEIEWTIFGVFLTLSLPNLKSTHIDLQKLRGYRLTERLDNYLFS
jgi:hypothetical protein